MSSPNPYNLEASGPATAVVVKRSSQSRILTLVLGILAILIASLLGLLVLLIIGVETGLVPFILGFFSAIVPVPLYVSLVLWIDRYESEPPWMLATAFFWGVLVAPFFSFLLNTLGALIVTLIAGKEAGETFALVISAPIVEESSKAAILLIFFFWKKEEFDGVVDGIVYASLVALGFAMTENILYYGKAALEHGAAGLTITFIVRGAFAPFSHPLFTSLTGIGLGIARQTNNLAVKYSTPVIGFLMAVFMHSIWNGSGALGGGGIFLLTYVIVMVPAFVIMLVVISLALRREGQVVREFLQPDFQNGLFTDEEYKQLCSIGGRMNSSLVALSRRGVKGWRTRMKFNQMASELAFHRSRVSRGFHESEDEAIAMEAAYLSAIKSLMADVRTYPSR
jgi:RsiW-degrading membrane proteinase PrsW (M82 family)